jgi:DNA-binding ferritin-like protein
MFEKTLEIDIELNKQAGQGVIEILNNPVCKEYVLYTKTRNYQWNVVSPNFSET